MLRLAELIVLLVAALSPLFYLAGTIDSDEVAKSALGLLQVAVVLAIAGVYRLWKRRHKDDLE